MHGRILVFGASGYVGRHLTARLLALGHSVRAAARRLPALEAEAWQGAELVTADALDPASLGPALDGVTVAYYLVHSMMAGGDFPARDRIAAANFAEAAASAGLQRIVYLGGLAPLAPDTVHLASRIETGDILRAGPVPVTELRAGIIVGPGSAAFEVMRDLVAHLPIMITPRWIYSKSPPLALDELLGYLIALPDRPEAAGQVLEAGGPERFTYEAMMRELAGRLGRRQPWIIPVPLLTPNLSSYWLALVTATPVNVASALITGLKHDLEADDRELRRLVPDQERIGFAESIARVFEAEQRDPCHRSLARGRLRAARLSPRRELLRQGDDRRRRGPCPHRRSSGGCWSGWATSATATSSSNPVWRLRAWLDRRLGGHDGGKRPADEALAPGTRFDFWRVLAATPARRLTLVSSLKAPGAGGMEFTITPEATPAAQRRGWRRRSTGTRPASGACSTGTRSGCRTGRCWPAWCAAICREAEAGRVDGAA